MNVSSPAPPYASQQLQQNFQKLAIDMSASNARLAAMSNTNSYPSSSWGRTFDTYAAGLDQARIGLLQLRPDAARLVDALGADVRGISANASTLRHMAEEQTTFGNWSNTLTSSIDHAQQAITMLYDAPAPQPGGPTDPVPPAPRPQLPTTRLTADVSRAIELITESMHTIQTVPANDHGSESTKQARLAAFHVNLAAQQLLEQHYTTETSAVTSIVRSADDYLVDAAWQLAKKPSDDGRFHGVDIPGALRSSTSAINALQQLTGGAQTPSSPATTPVPVPSGGATSTGDSGNYPST